MKIIKVVSQCRRNWLSKVNPKAALLWKAQKSYSQDSHSIQNKDLHGPFPLTYKPENVEPHWFEWWESNGYFTKEIQSTGKTFSMVLPPPNITGDLHLGHAFTVTIQDALARWNRMLGHEVLWVPGCDHAGIATQVVVEKMLKAERNLSRHDIGRENFINEVTKWKCRKIENIYNQLRALGASANYEKTCFTMDKSFSAAVTDIFVKLFEQGLIYRKIKLVNWCCNLQSVISDIEVDHVKFEGRTKIAIPGHPELVEFGIMDYFAYPTLTGDSEIVVGTTRLETMMGDVAVAVHPEDPRYFDLIGAKLVHPITGEIIPVVSDSAVDIKLGTGAVKITPGHDQLDYEIATRNGFKPRTIFNEKGCLVGFAGKLEGLNRFEARKQLRAILIAKNLHRKTESHPTTVPFCSRSRDVIEPMLKPQWFIKCEEFGALAVQAVENGLIEMHPSYNTKIWEDWFKNNHDWCISRQLWWGHRLPVYSVERFCENGKSEEKHWVAGKDFDDAFSKAQKRFGEGVTVRQDDDVLDTWFSSALFPLVALGWPNKSADLEKFYPLSLMETGHDILFFWVARMVILCQYVSNKLPFSQVLLHGMVCDSSGKKMSKSVGNVLDPMDIVYGRSNKDLIGALKRSHQEGQVADLGTVIKKLKKTFPDGIPLCGADSLRMMLASLNTKSRSVNVDIQNVVQSRNFGNKIWQACRFYLGHKETHNIPTSFLPLNSPSSTLTDTDKWILSRLARLVTSCNDGFKNFNLHSVVKALQDFWITEYCDFYLETVKLRRDIPSVPSEVMATCIYTFLSLICPVRPFIAEELYHRLFIKHFPEPSITIASYPKNEDWDKWKDEKLDKLIKNVILVTKQIRGLKVDYEVPSKEGSATIIVYDDEQLTKLEKYANLIKHMSRADEVSFKSSDVTELGACRAIDQEIKVFLRLEEETIKKHSMKIQPKINKLETELQKLLKITEKNNYIELTPLHVKELHEQKIRLVEEHLKLLKSSLLNT